MKYYDKGFIINNKESVILQIYNAGTNILELEIFEDRVCSSTFKCQSLKEFNSINLDKSYDDNFLKDILLSNKKNIVFRDKTNNILIKIIKD